MMIMQIIGMMIIQIRLKLGAELVVGGIVVMVGVVLLWLAGPPEQQCSRENI